VRNVRDYAVVSGAYWAFTLTDGALRMLVLLHLHRLGYSPMQVASMFLFYEFFGVVTNFVGGWLGARFGLKSTLFAGLSLQVVACALLAWRSEHLSIPLVMATQALAGVAKDLTKMSSKSFIKQVVPEGDARGLMKWVAVLTGSKNALKGVGFFMGGALLASVGFRGACSGMAIGLVLAVVVATLMLPRAVGKAKEVSLKRLVTKDARVNWLSAARLFLFGSRDVWFVLALPIYFVAELGWTHPQVGGFMATWVIFYGVVQALAPAWITGRRRETPTGRRLIGWTGGLIVPLGIMLVLLNAGCAPEVVLTIGLFVYGAIFAANSAVHSFLIVKYSDRDDVALNVGFYYMANAAGRLLGTVLSGAVFQAAGLGMDGLRACLVASFVMVLVSAVLCEPLGRAEEARNVTAGGE